MKISTLDPQTIIIKPLSCIVAFRFYRSVKFRPKLEMYLRSKELSGDVPRVREKRSTIGLTEPMQRATLVASRKRAHCLKQINEIFFLKISTLYFKILSKFLSLMVASWFYRSVKFRPKLEMHLRSKELSGDVPRVREKRSTIGLTEPVQRATLVASRKRAHCLKQFIEVLIFYGCLLVLPFCKVPSYFCP